MTTATARRDIHVSIADTRARLDQAAMEGAALRGELGIDAQLIALSAYYQELRLKGQHDAAAAVKAEAKRIYEETR